jgi:hypothetical protein
MHPAVRHEGNGYLECMGVNHGGAHAAMVKQLLHGADISIRLHQMGGKTVAQGMHRGRVWQY